MSISKAKGIFRRVVSTLVRRPADSDESNVSDDGNRDFPIHGFQSDRVATRYVDGLADKDLAELNRILRWHCFTADSHGRRFGRRSKIGKRESPQVIPDPRILRMNDRFKLAGKEVLEFGCFEGIHTIGLAMRGARVTAVDSRIENVVKSMVRTSLFGHQATLFKCDVENEGDWKLLPQVDLIHHVGVLYHLKDPAIHLLGLGKLAREGIMLDTHFAFPNEALERYSTAGREIPYKRYREGGRGEVFSGMYDHAKWLTLPTILELVSDAGFPNIDIVEERAERNGPRVLMFAARG
jgi:2-polyprenyl-3-methyl-5-hydroxy-6-metoxy-1,4-benzoquinol methylase